MHNDSPLSRYAKTKKDSYPFSIEFYTCIHTQIYITKYIANCLWGDWTDESACSKTCGLGGIAGVKHQGRVKLEEEDHGGICIGNSTRLSACYPNVNCPSKSIFGVRGQNRLQLHYKELHYIYMSIIIYTKN